MTGSLVSPELRAAVRGIAGPIARGFGRLGLSPNQLTVIGFLISAAGGVAAGLGLWLLAAGLVIFGGVFDLFDGALARATGKTSKFGALMDSTFDRWGEAVVYAGIATGMATAGILPGVVLASLATGSSFIVSYVRARAEGLGFSAGTGMAAVGLAPREIRLVVIAAGLFIAEPLGGVTRAGDGTLSQGATALLVILGALFVLTTLTVAQRMAYTAGQAARQEAEALASASAVQASAAPASAAATQASAAPQGSTASRREAP